MEPDPPNTRLLDRLAIVVGMFGTRGYPEIAVVTDDGTIEHLPLAGHLADKVRYARKVLAEFGRKPMDGNYVCRLHRIIDGKVY